MSRRGVYGKSMAVAHPTCQFPIANPDALGYNRHTKETVMNSSPTVHRFPLLAVLFLAAVALIVLMWSSPAFGEDPKVDKKTPPDPRGFYAEICALVKRYYPKASFQQDGSKLHFGYNTRDFMIHYGNKDGSWQDAHKENGPNPGGIYGDIEIRSGRVPPRADFEITLEFQRQTNDLPAIKEDYRYFVEYYFLGYSPKHDCHIYATLKCPDRFATEKMNVSKDFLKRFFECVTKFEELLPAKVGD
jgi:hypothetical protein